MVVMSHLAKIYLSIFAASTLSLFAQNERAADFIKGKSFNLTNRPDVPNGSWCWFEGERTVVDTKHPDGPLLLASTVSFAPGAKGPEAGDVDVLWRNLKTGEQGAFELHDRLQQDDHNSAALWIRPDGRYVAMYSKHHADQFSRYRISEPHDPNKWSEERVLTPFEKSLVTYSNLYGLGKGKDAILLNFRRAFNFNPNIWISPDLGENWERVGLLLREGNDGRVRPYVRYFGDGEQVHLVTTDGHPRDVNTSLWHGTVSRNPSGKLQLSSSTGEVLDPDLSDDNVASPKQLTLIIAPGEVVGGVKVDHAWPCDLALSPSGNPQAIFSVRVENSSEDHRFIYAHFDGRAWHKELLAAAGSYLYKRENDYTGLGAIHPRKFGELVIATPIDPRTGEKTQFQEIYRGKRSEKGMWSWDALTENSSMQNLRPEIPDWDSKQTVVLWLRGKYNTYTDQDMKAYGTLLNW